MFILVGVGKLAGLQAVLQFQEEEKAKQWEVVDLEWSFTRIDLAQRPAQRLSHSMRARALSPA